MIRKQKITDFHGTFLPKVGGFDELNADMAHGLP